MCEVGSTLDPLTKRSYNDVSKYISGKYEYTKCATEIIYIMYNNNRADILNKNNVTKTDSTP
jgi:hypothetical protein